MNAYLEWIRAVTGPVHLTLSRFDSGLWGGTLIVSQPHKVITTTGRNPFSVIAKLLKEV